MATESGEVLYPWRAGCGGVRVFLDECGRSDIWVNHPKLVPPP
jgi:hypothetical protein